MPVGKPVVEEVGEPVGKVGVVDGELGVPGVWVGKPGVGVGVGVRVGKGFSGGGG